MEKLKLWLVCLASFLAVAVLFLAGQTALLNSALASGIELRHAEEIQGILLRAEIPLAVLLILVLSTLQFLLVSWIGRSASAGSGLKSGDSGVLKESKNLYEQVLTLYKSAIMDEQTGAIIYRHFKTMLDLEFSRSHRYKMTFSLVKISVENKDDFKSAFPRVAACIMNILRNVDITSVGSDRKFIILLPNTKKVNAEIAVKRIWARIRMVEEQTNSKIRLAAGISTFKEDGDTVDLLLEVLDRNLEKARMLGANMIVF
jgi:GGDEF domain-containing protein